MGANSTEGKVAGVVPGRFLNHLYHGAIQDVLHELPDNSVDCIFADPDYNVGMKYQRKSYTKPFEKYIEECIDWASQCRRVLRPDGNFFIINYPKSNAHLRVKYLDDSFFAVYEYVWVYPTNMGTPKRSFTGAHRTILHCVKTRKNKFFKTPVAEPYQNPNDFRVSTLIKSGSPGRMPYSWIEAPVASDQMLSWTKGNLVKNVSRAKTFHSCQIPESLSEKLLRATTEPGDTVLVLFGGAGSELAVCQRLGLNWVSAEIVKRYCTLIEARLRNGGEVPPRYRLLSVSPPRPAGGQTSMKEIPAAQ